MYIRSILGMKNILLQILPLLSMLSLEEKMLIAKELNISNDLDNSILISDAVSENREECPHCHGKHIVKWGKRSGIQRYRCRECGRTFNSLTGTTLAHLHKKSSWLGMCEAMAETLTVRETAKKLGVCVHTAFNWRHRWIKGFAAHDNDKLNEIGELDEMYFPRSFKGSLPVDRKSRHRGGEAKTASNQDLVGVLFAVDRQGHEVGAVLKDHKNASVRAAMEGRLDNGCVLCLDGGSALIGYALKSGHEFKVTAPGRYVFTPDPHYHIQTVNACHSDFRTWMMRFHGVATKYLKNYVGWKRCLQTMLRGATPMAWLRNCIAPGQPVV